MILLIDNYDSFSFNLVQTLSKISMTTVEVRRNNRISLSEVFELKPESIVISPGPGHPANQRDFGINADLIRNQARINCPILGVCLGHQGIVHTLGGSIVKAPNIMHGKTSQVKVFKPSRLFEGCHETFKVMRYHSLVAIDDDLPEALAVTARDIETNAIMAIEHVSAPVFGLQFHPESIGTPDGENILRNFVRIARAEKQRAASIGDRHA